MGQINDEKRLIEMISSVFAESKLRLSKCFESDAEVLSFSGQRMLFTMDEFSSEDMFRENDAYSLGWNVAAGGMSDISACGGVPLFYGHAMVVDKSWDDDFVKTFANGVSDVLKKSGIVFIGGDFGKAENWRYTAAVIGQPRERLLNRKGAVAGDSIYISGKIGSGNLEAALSFFSPDPRWKVSSPFIKNRFHLRLREAALISNCANCCIDTSDGVFNGLNSIAEINGVGYEISDLPYVEIGAVGASLVSLPKELLFLGEAGEYELLFTIKPEREPELLSTAKQQRLTFYKIGNIVDSGRTLSCRNKIVDLSRITIRARDFINRKEYLDHLIRYLGEQS
ncbi:MAG: thiamine-monophosphate kinase [Candidatus Omnitrophica bacterium]|nr:thiamine-monophosphate kinase [Candidatus Omnitrophota bacterium]